MTKRKILIIDDEKESIRPAFDLANALNFNDELEFTFVPRSQDIDYGSLREEFDLIIVDITLAKRSEFDGYGIIKKFVAGDYYPVDRTIILTGNSQVKSELERLGLPTEIEIVTKPVTFNDITTTLRKYL